MISHAVSFSRYLKYLLEKSPWFLDELPQVLHQAYTRDAMQQYLQAQAITDEETLKAALRRLKQAVLARLIVRDVNDLANLDEVVTTASTLADVAVGYALQHLEQFLQPRYGQPIGCDSGLVQPLLIVGMGKLGGGELNVSSDIDLVFLYEEDGDTNGKKSLSNHEYFVILGKKLINALHEVTGDGYVYRVDMRLRPYGDSGPLVCSFAMLENYLITQGREWERYAWTKARLLNASVEATQAFMQIVRPFVFRKYLDYGAYASMRDLHGQIRREVERRDLRDNIKLGPGGIREVEFIAQVFQLIRGGRERELQTRSTREALELLALKHLLPEETVMELGRAYTFLRNLEHRLQYLDDQQTQTLPTHVDDQQRIADSMGFAHWEALRQTLDYHRHKVARHFEQVFVSPQGENHTHHPLAPIWQGVLETQEAVQQLAQLGYRTPEALLQQLYAVRQSSRYQQLPANNRTRFDALLPQLLAVAATLPNADVTFTRILTLMEAIARRESYLALLVEYPQTLSRVAKLYSASPWVSDYVTRHPLLLDELLDLRLLHAVPEWQKLTRQLTEDLQTLGNDTEQQMDALRHFQHTQTFRLAAQDIAGLLPLETLSDHLSALADTVLTCTQPPVWQTLRKRHCEQPKFAIIGYGKLGGKELGYASDLDIVFLYEDEHPDALDIYARFAQRLNTWLSTNTVAGSLYETDLRLRPNGESGFLVSSMAAFAHYQRHEAWLWEHQALTRARFCAGDRAVGEKFEQIRHDILAQVRDLPTLRQEIVAMREKMRAAHPKALQQFDVKHSIGTIIDVEFLVQFLILAYAHLHPALTANRGNIALLQLAAELGLLPTDAALAVANAYRRYRQLQHQLRLAGDAAARPDPSEFDKARHEVRRLWAHCGLAIPALENN